MSYLINSFPQRLLLFLIIFTPLAFGSVHVWAFTVMEIGVLILVIIFTFKMLSDRKEIKWAKTPVYALMFLFAAYVFLQTVPVSDRILQAIAPKQLEIHQRLDAVLQTEEPTHSASALSLNPHHTRVALFKLLGYFGVFLFIINTIRTRKQINQIVLAVISMGVFESLYGMAQKVSGSHNILWWSNIFGSSRISGTFINTDHLAGFLEMVIMLNIGYVISLGRRRRRNRPREQQTWRQRLSGFLRREQTYNKQILLIYPIAIMLIGLFLTASRGGLLAFAAGLVTIVLFSMRQLKPRTTFGLMTLIVGIVFAFSTGLEEQTIDTISKRYQTLFAPKLAGQVRLDVYESTKPLVNDFPVTGTGWGTFPDIYPKYQPKKLIWFFTNAHNDWLELLIETGAIGSTLALMMIFFYFYRFIRLWATRNDPYAIGIGLGVLGSAAAIFTHSLMDFNLHIPANAFLFSVILGVGFAALHNQKHRGNETTLTKFRIIKTNSPLRWGLMGLAALGFFCLGQPVVHRLLAELNCPTEINSTLKLDRTPSMDKIKRALNYEPGNSACRVKLIPIYQENKKLEPTRYFRKFYTEESIKTLEKALRSNPAQANFYILLGKEYFELSLLDSRNRERLIDKSIKAYENAVYFDPKNYKNNLKTAESWLTFTRKTPFIVQKVIYSQKALELLKTTVGMNPESWKEALKIASTSYYPKQQLLDQVIPGSETSKRFNVIRLLAKQWLKSHT
ncbi:MAG: O-antigen ligase family protein [Nitrospinales bacterium]